MSDKIEIEEFTEEVTLSEEKGTDLFERAFGKAPEVGYDFKYVDLGIYHRAVVIRWSASGIGFGELAIVLEDKKIKIDTEYMGKDFCDALIEAMAKKLEEEESMEPKKTFKELMEGVQENRMPSTFLKTLYANVDWETEINPYVSPDESSKEEETANV